jgi:hypothetical protein
MCRFLRSRAIFSLFGLVVCLPLLPAHAEPKLVFEESGNVITVTGVVGNDGSFQRSFRLRAEGGEAHIRFLPSDLSMQTGALIDRRNVTVTGDSQLGTQSNNYILSVSGVTGPGEYEGRIEVFGHDGGDAVLRIPVKLNAKVQPVITIDPATPSFTIKLASGCGWLTKVILGPSLCRGEHAVFLRSAAGSLPATRSLELIAVNEQKETLADSQASIALSGNRLVLAIDPTKVAPGHYTGRAIARFESVQPTSEVPIDLQVRIGPAWPLVAVIAGILIGRLAKVMRERGDREAELRLRFNRILNRVQLLPAPSRQALLYLQNTADRSIDQEALDRATTDVANFEAGSEILATLQRYRGHPNFAQANGAPPHQRDASIVADIATGNLTNARATLDQIGTGLAVAAAAAAAVVGGGPGPMSIWRRAQLALETIRNKFVQYLARPLMTFILLIALTYVGLSALYIDGSATFGVRPLAELFALFAWGLSADVASRTLANIRG